MIISVAAWLWHWHDAYNLLILMYSRFLEKYIIRQTDVCKMLNIKVTAMTGRTVVISQNDRAHVSRWTQKACICPERGVSSVQHLVDGQELCMYGNDLHMERPNSSHYWNSLNQKIQDVFTVMAFYPSATSWPWVLGACRKYSHTENSSWNKLFKELKHMKYYFLCNI